ncbi:hypothetical protein HF086_013740 [Spodoptera exigua]|uniref:THAP-type domain-containing protein n=1 Tax=Spodoptera exigua TaxID=7107 RepID=A0A922MBU5_SPOEX|nr:hypothetical protein HF086_013740 [Spodoptera exigua]
MGHDCCCVVNCKNNGLNSKCKFYIFPRASYKIEQRRKWIAAVNRKNADGTQWSPKPHDKICSEHFIGGKKSEEQLSPSYVPTIFPTIYRKKKVNQSQVLARYTYALDKILLLFQLPNDMQNYMRYHIMGSVPKVLMKSGCVPTKFECQQGKTKRLSDTAERSSVSKKSKKVLMDEKDIVKQSTTTTQLEFSGSSWHSPVQEQEEVEVKIENTEEYLIEAEENYQFESVQVDVRFHDKEVQTKPELADNLEMQRTEEAIASAAVFIPEAVERSDMEVDCAGDRSMDEALVWLKVEVDDSGGDTTDSAPEVELKIIKDEPVSDDLNE